jgi:hypothetical protein
MGASALDPNTERAAPAPLLKIIKGSPRPRFFLKIRTTPCQRDIKLYIVNYYVKQDISLAGSSIILRQDKKPFFADQDKKSFQRANI